MGIGPAMAGVGLVAAGLALTRGLEPMIVGAYGPLLAVLFWIFFEGVIRRRRLEGFHYATAIVAVPVSGFIARQVAMGRFRPLAPLDGAWRWVAGATTPAGRPWGEFLIGGVLSLLLGLLAGWMVRRLERARGWDLAPFFRGAVVGSFLAVPILLVAFDTTVGEPSPGERLARLGVLAAGFVVGGLAGAAKG